MTRGTLFCLAVLLCACGEAAPPPSLQDAQIVFTGFDSVTMELREGEGRPSRETWSSRAAALRTG